MQDLGKWSLSTSDALARAQGEIRAKSGFTVKCDRGWYGLWGSLSEDNCAVGLTRINAALEKVKPPVNRDQINRLTLELGRPGLWQGLTFSNRDMRIPYNANPETMAKFVSSELNLLFNTSLADLVKANEGMIKRIKSEYFIQVEPLPILDVYETHDGLKKAEIAMRVFYGGQKPSEQEFRKLGIDTLVLSQAGAPLMEENGQLALTVDIDHHPGEIFMNMIHAVDTKGKTNWVGPARWTWEEVNRFRADRDQVNRMLPALQKALAVREIQCNLSYLESGSIHMSSCRKGLELLQRAAANEKVKNIGNVRGVQKIVVKDLTFSKVDFDQTRRLVEFDPDIDADDIAEAFRNE